MAIPLRKFRRKPVEVDEPTRRRFRRPGKRSIATGVTAVLVAGVAGIALLAGGGAKPEAATNADLEFASVRRTDLVSVRSFNGEVSSKAGPNILGRLSGTITWLPEVGAKIERGQPLYAVDGLPIILFYGTTPAFRDFGGSITGNDVKQLEENLDALGFDPGAVDTTFTSTTTSAVRAWQDALVLTANGVVQLGRVVFAPGPLTIAELLKDAGSQAQPGEDVLSTESSERVVEVTLDDTEDLAAGDEVSIVPSDNSRVPATVTSVDTPSGMEAGDTQPVATIAPDDANALASLDDGADVDVELVEDAREDVLVVPVTALLARSGGGYAVQVQNGGSTRLVTVEPGLYADDLVEIDGDVDEGDRVVVP